MRVNALIAGGEGRIAFPLVNGHRRVEILDGFTITPGAFFVAHQEFSRGNAFFHPWFQRRYGIEQMRAVTA